MKKIPLLIGMVAGAFIGLFASIHDGTGLKIVLMSIGVVTGGAIGNAFSRQGKKMEMALHEDDESFGQGISARDRMRNYWRDKGRVVRFMEPPDIGGTHRDFDQ